MSLNGKQITVNVEDLKNVICPHCGCDTFTNHIEVKIIPALLSGSGTIETLNVQRIACTACASILLKEDVERQANGEKEDD